MTRNEIHSAFNWNWWKKSFLYLLTFNYKALEFPTWKQFVRRTVQNVWFKDVFFRICWRVSFINVRPSQCHTRNRQKLIESIDNIRRLFDSRNTSAGFLNNQSLSWDYNCSWLNMNYYVSTVLFRRTSQFGINFQSIFLENTLTIFCLYLLSQE